MINPFVPSYSNTINKNLKTMCKLTARVSRTKYLQIAKIGWGLQYKSLKDSIFQFRSSFQYV